jgi:hypothetical protein
MNPDSSRARVAAAPATAMLLAITDDLAAHVECGDLPGAKAHIKNLALAWDSAEAGLKPRAAEHWPVLDQAIDSALAALRPEAATEADGKSALSALLGSFNSWQGKAGLRGEQTS